MTPTPTYPPHPTASITNTLFLTTNLQIIRALELLLDVQQRPKPYSNTLIFNTLLHAHIITRATRCEIFTKQTLELNYFYYICMIFSIRLWNIFHMEKKSNFNMC